MKRSYESIRKQIVIGMAMISLLFTGAVSLASRLVDDIPLDNNRELVNLPLMLEAVREDSLLAGARGVREINRFESILQTIETESEKTLEPHEAWELARVVIDESRNFGKDPLFTLSIIKIESNFNRYAVSPVNARGLMQLLPSTAKALAYELDQSWDGQDGLFDIRTNIRLGLYYFHKLERRFGMEEVALAAYNFGPTYISKVIEEGGRIPRKYAAKVMGVYRGAFLADRKA